MQEDERVRLAEIMGRIAGGDEAAAMTLYLEFGSQVRAKVAALVRAQGATHLNVEDLDGLAIDACLDLARRAGSWDPDGGALPWVWAERPLRAIVTRYVGQYADAFDEAAERAAERRTERTTGGADDVAFAGHDPDEDEVLGHLAHLRPECALFAEALGRVATPRNRRIALMYEMQRLAGDPSPAVTVGMAHGVRPDAVRQVVHRTKARLARLAGQDARFAPLAVLPFVAGSRAA